ncbi:hypothetical protein DEHRE_04430 [Dehalobacter restrictus DSM 9455]|uniref:Uncharacterized protein n=1 Tax=Dehalobacter restrictus (strain DSM 9455 / PER-K23) TaxID=871738 RepID=A0ABM5P981_DEHRP|nr:hypothetical protein DEHRE_04430 [Dehalobacter restrictus DSM 9455]
MSLFGLCYAGFSFLDEEKADKNRFVCAILTESYYLRFILLMMAFT